MPLLASMGPRGDPETREGRHEDMQLTALSKNERGRSQVRVAGGDVGWTAEEEPGSDGRPARGGPLIRLGAGDIVGGLIPGQPRCDRIPDDLARDRGRWNMEPVSRTTNPINDKPMKPDDLFTTETAGLPQATRPQLIRLIDGDRGDVRTDPSTTPSCACSDTTVRSPVRRCTSIKGRRSRCR